MLRRDHGPLLRDDHFFAAVASLLLRAEQQLHTAKLLETYVDRGLLDQVNNRTHQVIYGRRGTGKTHLLKVLATRLAREDSNIPIYIDARTLGSTAQYLDPTYPLSLRCTLLFRDILNEVHNGIMDFVAQKAPASAPMILAELEELATISMDKIHTIIPTDFSHTSSRRKAEETTGSVEIHVPASLGLSRKSAAQEEKSLEEAVQYKVQTHDTVVFPAVQHALRGILAREQLTLYILFDEWSSIPMDVQPFLAEFVRRAFLPDPHLVIKIGAVEYRTSFLIRNGIQPTGMEVGSDIMANATTDDYFLYEVHPERVVDGFLDLLFKHIASQPIFSYIRETYTLGSAYQLLQLLFDSPAAFEEMVRSAEGNPRDFINIVSRTITKARLRQCVAIDVDLVRDTAWEWYVRDKAPNLDSTMRQAFGELIGRVCIDQRTRYFLVAHPLSSHLLLRQLLDARVLHLLAQEVLDVENPTTANDLYSVDYTVYASVVRQLKDAGPHERMLQAIPAPFDPKRDIPKVIIGPEIFL
jgi:hypothetical protein